jgi:NADH-quinone oxidoreductase subunit N
MDHIMPVVPMILGVAGGAAAMLLDAWGRRAASVLCALAGLVAGAGVAAWSARAAATVGMVGAGGAYSALAAACLALGAIALTASFRTLAETREGPRIATLAAFATSAAALLAASLDLGILFLSVEALALCGYGLVALGNTDRAREAAMKWFVQGSVATALMIVGIAVLISRTGGSLTFAAIRDAASAPAASGPLAIGLVLVLTALAFKAGAFPFHSWMPDALETAPATGAAVLASAGKVGPIAAAVWLASAAAGATGDRLLGVVALLSVGSIVFGNLAALRQRSLARMLGYSAIAQVGYALAGLPMADGRPATLLFIGLYGLTSVASFVFIVAVRELEPGWDGSIAGLAGLSRRHPGLATSLVPIMLSLTGIPLTAGFWGKFVVFGVAASQGYLWLAIVAVLGSVVSFGYYGAVLRSVFLDDAPSQSVSAEPPIAPVRGSAPASSMALAVVIIVIGVLPLVTGLGLFGR